MVFVWTEFLSSVCVCLLANKANDVKSEHSDKVTKPMLPMYIISMVSMVHLWVGGVDELFIPWQSIVRFARYSTGIPVVYWLL